MKQTWQTKFTFGNAQVVRHLMSYLDIQDIISLSYMNKICFYVSHIFIKDITYELYKTLPYGGKFVSKVSNVPFREFLQRKDILSSTEIDFIDMLDFPEVYHFYNNIGPPNFMITYHDKNRKEINRKFYEYIFKKILWINCQSIKKKKVSRTEIYYKIPERIKNCRIYIEEYIDPNINESDWMITDEGDILQILPIMEVIIIYETCINSYAYCKYQLWIGLKDNNDVIITLETDNNNVDIYFTRNLDDLQELIDS